MTKAHELLCAWVKAIDEHSNRGTSGKILSETTLALWKVEQAARAYLNEKPHEPPQRVRGHLGSTVDGGIDDHDEPASPPHAAAEPEKPVALLPCPFCGAAPILHERDQFTGHQPVECPTKDCPMSRAWPDVSAWQKRASPSAQPIEQRIHELACEAWGGYGTVCDALRTIHREATAAQPIARDEQDAKRYRWVRVNKYMDIASTWLLPHGMESPAQTPEQLDAAIDAALKSAGKE